MKFSRPSSAPPLPSSRVVEERLFEAASVLPIEERSSWLNDACAGQTDLRERIDTLLNSHDAAGFMEWDVPGRMGNQTARLAPFRFDGAMDGPCGATYQVLEQIGEGASAVVWMARQLEPVERPVALKMSRTSLNSGKVKARFQAEWQAMALMDHPNITRIHGCGITGLPPSVSYPFKAGRPYLVLEWVQGVPITLFCDEHRCSLRQRLEFFSDVCSAIHHSHQRGIIHRDIKPSNVLVTRTGIPPTVKIIDFGIAQAAPGAPDGPISHISPLEWLGTPGYLSPEQASPYGRGVDARDDIYALGCLLYEILTGSVPSGAWNQLATCRSELLPNEREDVFPALSPRNKNLPLSHQCPFSQERKIALNNLDQWIKPELDRIVRKSLANQASRRYQTVVELMHDIRKIPINLPSMVIESTRASASKGSPQPFHEVSNRDLNFDSNGSLP